MGQLGIWQLFIILIVVGIGFVPFIIASRRRHTKKWLVLIVSFLTFIGWIIALVWAITGEVEEDNPPSETFE